MKCTFCEQTTADMPTIPEFLGLDRITSNLETGICGKCQKLPLDDIKKRFQMATIFAAEFWKKTRRSNNGPILVEFFKHFGTLRQAPSHWLYGAD